MESPLWVLLCIPGNTFSGTFLDSFLEFVGTCFKSGIKLNVIRRESPVVYYVRNLCLLGDVLRGESQMPFNGQIPYTHILWLDSDIIFHPNQFITLLNHDKDIISGVYKMSDGRHYAAVENWDEEYFKQHGTFQFLTDEDMNREGLIEVDYSGMGFMLVKYGVFEYMNYPWFEPKFYEIGSCKDFCAEDVSFCHKAKNKGFKIYVDPRVRVGHEKRVLL